MGKSKTAVLCECEDLCASQEGWAISYKENSNKPEKSKCFCYTKKKNKVKTKNARGYVSFELPEAEE